MRDLSRQACRDHPCDRCATCRAGRCCQRDTYTPQYVIDHTTEMLFGAALADREPRPSVGREMPSPTEESHRIVWVASKPEPPDSRITAEDALRAREHRTREKWAGEDDVIDAEVVEDVQPPGELGISPSHALPPGQSAADLFAWMQQSEEDHRDR